MDGLRKIPTLERFLKNGGTFVVVRPIPDAYDGDRTVLSLEARRKLALVREKAGQDNVDLVLIPPEDETAFGTVADRRWPAPVFVSSLRLPPEGSRDGNFLIEARAQMGNVSMQEYARNAVVGEILFRWGTVAAAAIAHALEARMVSRGRVIVCGGEPFIALLASFLIPNRSSMIGNWASGLSVRVYDEEGFVVRLEEAGRARVLPLFPKLTMFREGRGMPRR